MNNKLFLDLDGTIAKFNVRNALERFDKEKGFFAKLGAYKGIESINELTRCLGWNNTCQTYLKKILPFVD